MFILWCRVSSWCQKYSLMTVGYSKIYRRKICELLQLVIIIMLLLLDNHPLNSVPCFTYSNLCYVTVLPRESRIPIEKKIL